MPDSIIEQLAQSFRRFPGIGPRQAKRFVHHLLHSSATETEALLRQIRDLRAAVRHCADCRRHFTAAGRTEKLCRLCQDRSRDSSLLMLVEKDIDLDNIERSGTYHGYYFVLGGLVPIPEKNPEQSLPLEALLSLIKQKKPQEIIIALAATTEGDHTLEFIKNFLSSTLHAPNSELKISTLGRGLSTGAELEYSDPETIKNALKHRE